MISTYHFTFDIPKSWKGRSGKRFNTLMQRTSQNDWGLETVNVLTNDVGYKPSKNEVRAYEKEKEQLEQSLMAGMEVVVVTFPLLKIKHICF